MTAKDLKNALLQEAVQGKLVPQIASEGNARDLLNEIKRQKAKLIADGKIKKEKPLPEITDDEIPFDIPENWCWCRLGDIINIKSGDGLTSQQMKNGPIPVYGGNGVNGYHNVANVHKETVVIGRVGYYCGSIHITPNEAWVTDNAFITTYPENQINRLFLVFILQHLNLGQDNNATAQPVVSGKKIYPILFPLPPLAEQKRIVAAIERFMPLIEEYGKKEDELRQLNASIGEQAKKALLQEAVQGRLVPQMASEGNARDLLKQIQAEKAKLIKDGKLKKEKPLPPITDDEKPFDIPENWCWCRLGEIIDTNIGLTYSPSDVVQSKCTAVLRSNNILNGKMNYDDLVYVSMDIPEKCLAKTGDLLICARNGSRSLVGKCALIEKDGMAFGAFMALVRSKFTPFIMYFINSPVYRSKLEGVSTTTINQITQNNLRETLFPLPPLSEQKRIVAKLEELLPLCEKLGR